MGKKMMVLALAVISAALFAMPAIAAAQSWHLDSAASFTVAGSGGTLTWENRVAITCNSTTGTGAFSTTTEGTATLVFTGCKDPVFGFTCTSPGQPTGTIAFAAKFDAIMVGTSKPALLFTPEGSSEPTPGMKTLFEESCLGISEKAFGKGIVGTIGTAACGIASSTATVSFSSSESGHQADSLYTGSVFRLMTTLSSSHPLFSLDFQWSLTFAAPRTMTCTN